MRTHVRQWLGLVVVTVALVNAVVFAHPMMVKGTVAAIEATRIQVKTGEEKKGETPEWILVNTKTKVFRARTEVPYEPAKIKVDERVVVNADHDAKGVMTATEIHLAAAK